MRTVFYTDGKGRRVGYAIVSGQHCAQAPRRARSTGTSGTPYHLGYVNGTPVVTWERDGHLCVVSGHGMTARRC